MTEQFSLQTGKGYSQKVEPREGAFQVLVDFIWMTEPSHTCEIYP